MYVYVTEYQAEWCGPCDQQEEIFEDVKEEWEDEEKVEFEVVDIDEDQERAQQKSVRSLPTIIIETEEETDESTRSEYERFVGVTGEDDLNEVIEENI